MIRAKRLITVMTCSSPRELFASLSLIEDAQSPGKGCQQFRESALTPILMILRVDPIREREMLYGADKWSESNPLRVISVWFEGRPAELQADLASLISSVLPELVPGAVEAGALDEAAFFFRRALRAEGEPLVLAARAAALSAAIDLIFLERSTQEAWLLYRDCLEHFREETLATGKKASARLFEAMMDEIPPRSALWISEAQRWRLLRSQEALEIGRAGEVHQPPRLAWGARRPSH